MMSPEPTAAALRRIMAKNNLSNRDIANIACVHIHTVESWLADRASVNFRLMAPRHLNAIAAMLPGFLMTRASRQKEEIDAAKKKRRVA